VRRVLREGRFRQGARRLQDEIARQPDPVTVIVETLEQLVALPVRPTPLATSLGTKH
jgi:UDP:flavonoid glycosyltransferase YjiC (YdhE family)